MGFEFINFGFFSLRFFGILVGLGVLIASGWWYYALPSQKLSQSWFAHHFWHWLLGALLGGRLVSWLSTELFSAEKWQWWTLGNFWQLGFAVEGMILGFGIWFLIDLYRSKQPIGAWLDSTILPLLILTLITGIGGLFTGAFHGAATDLWWGVSYQLISVSTVNSVHPLGLYYALLALALGYGYFRRRLSSRSDFFGGTFCWWFGWWIVGDFVFQFFRGDFAASSFFLSARQGVDLVILFFIALNFKRWSFFVLPNLKKWSRSSQIRG